MESLGNFFDKLLKAVAGLSFLLVAFGAFDAYSFYGRFSIPIMNFINPSEIILQTISNSGFLFLSILSQLVIWLWLFKSSQTEDDLKKKKYFTSKGWALVAVVVFLLSTSILPITSEYYDFSSQIFSLFFFIIPVAISIILFFLAMSPLVYESLKFQVKIANPKIWTAIIIFSANTLMLIVCKNIVTFNTINRNGNQSHLQIVLNGRDTVSQTDKISYIGKTQDYFFYWDKVNLKSIVYPSSQVTKVTIDYNFKK